jgi:hypothetical protein
VLETWQERQAAYDLAHRAMLKENWLPLAIPSEELKEIIDLPDSYVAALYPHIYNWGPNGDIYLNYLELIVIHAESLSDFDLIENLAPHMIYMYDRPVAEMPEWEEISSVCKNSMRQNNLEPFMHRADTSARYIELSERLGVLVDKVEAEKSQRGLKFEQAIFDAAELVLVTDLLPSPLPYNLQEALRKHTLFMENISNYAPAVGR